MRHFPRLQERIRAGIDFAHFAGDAHGEIFGQGKSGQIPNAGFTGCGAPPLFIQIYSQRRNGIIA
jgi:hypothetical protein